MALTLCCSYSARRNAGWCSDCSTSSGSIAESWPTRSESTTTMMKMMIAQTESLTRRCRYRHHRHVDRRTGWRASEYVATRPMITRTMRQQHDRSACRAFFAPLACPSWPILAIRSRSSLMMVMPYWCCSDAADAVQRLMHGHACDQSLTESTAATRTAMQQERSRHGWR